MGILRAKIEKTMAKMFEGEDKKTGIYPTTVAYNELLEICHCAKIEGVGWMYAEACIVNDRGDDIRKTTVPDLLDRANDQLKEN